MKHNIIILLFLFISFFPVITYAVFEQNNKNIESYDDYVNKGIRYYLRKNYKQALCEMQKAKARKITPKVYYWLGEIYISLNNNEQARLYFNKAIGLYILKEIPIDFTYVIINAEKAYLFYLKKNYQMAIKYFEVSLKYAPTDNLKQYYRDVINELKKVIIEKK